jgi:hypothetical protein
MTGLVIWMELVMQRLLNKTSATNRTNSKTDETARLAYMLALI